MTSLTFLTLLVVVYGVLNRRGYGRALALAGATPVGAALVLSGTALPTFYAVALGAAFALVGQLVLRTRRFQRVDVPRAPGMLPLLLFTLYAVLVTLIAPFLFEGVAVLSPAGTSYLAAGLLTQSNIAQSLYLVLGVTVVAFLGRSRWAGPELIGTAAGLATVLSFWSYLNYVGGIPYPANLFDNSPGFTYIATAVGGAVRFRGIFSEPSGLGGSCLVTIAYMLSRAPQVTGLRRLGTLAVAAVAAYLGFVSTSASFVIASIAVAVIAAIGFAARFVLRRGPFSALSATVTCVGIVAGLWLLPVLANAVGQVVSDKVGSTSYSERSGADTFSYHLLLHTYGVGAGLGSNRASSFLASMLSTVGLVGTGLFVAVVWALIRAAYPVRNVRPVVWALVALLTTKVIGGPDLGDTSGVLWMSLGVLAHAALSAGRAVRPDVRRLVAARPSPGSELPAGGG